MAGPLPVGGPLGARWARCPLGARWGPVGGPLGARWARCPSGPLGPSGPSGVWPQWGCFPGPAGVQIDLSHSLSEETPLEELAVGGIPMRNDIIQLSKKVQPNRIGICRIFFLSASFCGSGQTGR